MVYKTQNTLPLMSAHKSLLLRYDAPVLSLFFKVLHLVLSSQ